MSTSQRVSRGFHRLAFFLAGIVFLIGGFVVIVGAINSADSQHTKLTCAHEKLAKEPKPEGWPNNPSKYEIDLQSLGCADRVEAFNLDEAQNPPRFYWLREFFQSLPFGVAITLVVTFAVYGVVRAIGWVIGGFTAS